MTKMNILRAFWPIALAALGVLLFASVAIGQNVQWSSPATNTALPADEAFVLSHETRADGGISLTWQVTPGYYLYRDKLEVRTASGPVALDLPDAELTEDLTFGSTHVYRQDITLDLAQQRGVLSVGWQGCQDDGICYAPQSTKITLGGGAASLTLSDEARVMDRLGAQGVPILLLAFFGFGLALAFTPCVLPMVPILGGYLARDGAQMTRRRGFILSLAYVVAMAAAFGLLGMAAAATGQNLQMVLQSPVAIALVIALFVVLAVSMFGLFDIRLPNSWVARIQGKNAGARGTLPGALGLGFTSALVVGPCVTAPLAAALLYIAQTGDMMLGSAALFMLGLGKGAPLVVFGTLGAKYLPRSGVWMVRVKQGFGFIFLALALWLAGRFGQGPWIVAGWALVLAGFALFLLRVALPDLRGPRSRILVGALAICALLPAGVLALGAVRGADNPLRPFAIGQPASGIAPQWQTVTDRDGLQAALAAPDQPVVIYLTADWCVSCRTIERRVLPSADVSAALDGMTRIKVDLSDFNAEGQALMNSLGAAGPPTMIFLDATLQEGAGTRLIGETRAAPVIESAKRVQP
ncbi:MAG: protein-disulfide reductase DsbD [Rhodobacteraceae bacterium]|nr:protein-disulfide reductase DsbD [Paracoccaceae bacterium]